jgi:hypothetical protein
MGAARDGFRATGEGRRPVWQTAVSQG